MHCDQDVFKGICVWLKLMIVQIAVITACSCVYLESSGEVIGHGWAVMNFQYQESASSSCALFLYSATPVSFSGKFN